MGDKSAIQWTDATWNPVVGCSVVSPGCKRCYAMREARRLERFGGPVGAKYAGLTEPAQGGPVWTGTVRLHEPHLNQPLRWKRPRKIFVNSMSDLFHEALPDEAIDRVFAVMALCPQHTFQILTKRAGRMRDYMEPFDRRRADSLGEKVVALGYDGPLEALRRPLPNVWLGVSAEDQRRANERIPHLLATPAAVRFVSAEPLLGPVDLTTIPTEEGVSNALTADYYLVDERGNLHLIDGPTERIDWVIVGGESGPGARDFGLNWAYDIIDQCSHPGAAAVYVKQIGARPWNAIPSEPGTLQTGYPITDRKGGDWDEWPEGLRVRDFPVGPTDLPWDD